MYSAAIIDSSWIYKYQEKLMEMFLKRNISTKLIKSPFREDNRPTCGFYYAQSGKLYLHDFGTGQHFDVIDVGMRILNRTKKQLLEHVLTIKDTLEEKSISLDRDYTYEYIPGEDKVEYFKRFHISKEILSQYGVKAAKAIYIDGALSSRSTLTNPIYVYTYKDKFKVYRPLTTDREKKWGGNFNAEIISGWDNLPKKGDILFITSSLKDVMVLKVLGYNAIAFQGESYGISNKTMELMARRVKELRGRFKHIIYFLDNDIPGIQNSVTLSHIHKLSHIYLPVGYPKDISDYIFKYGIKATAKRIKKLLSRKYRIDEFPF